LADKFTGNATVSQLHLFIPNISDMPVVRDDGKKGRVQEYGNASTPFRLQLDRQLVLLPGGQPPLLPDDHFVFFIIDFVQSLDLSALMVKYKRKIGVGRPAYDPTVMLTLILFCYCNGVTSSRGIERHCREHIPCRIITGNQTPDHATIASFLLKHREQFDNIFQQVLEVADQAELIKLDHIAIDGSKIQANASKHKAMSYERMCERLEKHPVKVNELETQLEELKKEGTERASKDAEKIRYEIGFQKKRIKNIKTGKKALEKRTKERTIEEAKKKKEKRKKGKKNRKIPNSKEVVPKPKDQFNFTDPESRIMGHAGGEFDQRYNAQIAVDSVAQIIVAHDVVQYANDKKLLEPMLKQVQDRLGQCPKNASADAGYFNEEHIRSEALELIELFVPPDRENHPRKTQPAIGRIPLDISTSELMRRKLSTTKGKKLYKQRKCIVEPVFGQVKHSVFGFDQFSWRGLQNVKRQWALVCVAHNLVKIWRNKAKVAQGESQPPPVVSAA